MVSTLFVGRSWLHYESLPSTNAFAQEYLSKNKPSEGMVITAANQTEGRGQLGSKWISTPDKNIQASIILYPHFLPAHQQSILNQSMALAVRDTVAKYVENTVKIKWPNDIYVGGNKIAGILIQNSLLKGQIKYAIVGVGINVLQIDFPMELKNTTSILLENEEELPLEQVLLTLFQRIEYQYLTLKRGNFSAIQKGYFDCLYQYQEWATYRRTDADEVFEGKITGVSSEGGLEVLTKEGMEIFGVKEIQFLKDA